jgi:NAD(P)-dependent dehydrogenase (short-subunit alcohol dehydrogenase family)
MTERSRRALVTGAASGIGAAVAAELSARGLSVVGLDKDECPGLDAVVLDLSDLHRLDQVIDELDAANPVDVLVNCAGVFVPQLASDLTLEQFEWMLRVNLHAPTLLMSRLASRMARRGFGRIVTVTSIHSRFSEPTALAYDVAKAGLEAATRTVAIESANNGVLVNAVAPGFINTAMSIVDGENELESEYFADHYLATGRLPMRRAAQPAEVATAIAYLVSEENTYITGSTLTIDGGLCARF